ncbi:MAG: hypothetical protein MJE68_01225 [Proteobacteria bacterium]|nr:hypothetical protein [Pseudomonadota bacterium]
MNDLPCIIVTALSAGHLLEEVKLHSTDAAIPVQINTLEDLLQCLNTSLHQLHLPFSLPLLDQRGSFETRDWAVLLLPRLEVTAGGERDESVGASV